MKKIILITIIAFYANSTNAMCPSPPSTPGPINGSTNIICYSTSNQYGIAPVNGATSYTWTLPSGWTGTSSTDTIIVTAGSSSGTISVVANNSSGSSASSSLAITVGPPSTPGPIFGSTSICNGTTHLYSVTGAGVNGVTSYTWTLPSGWSGTSSSSFINVTAGSVSGTISVIANSSCGSSVSRSLAITVGPSSTPGAIIGSTSICNGTTNTYSVTGVNGATSYSWTLPNGWTGTSSSNLINVIAGSVSGTISVIANNSCGSSSSSSLAITIPSITVNSPTICYTSNATLTASGAAPYSWSPATGLSSSTSANPIVHGQATTTYTVTGQSSGCTSTAISTVTVIPLPSLTPTSQTICQGQTATFTGNGADTYIWNGADSTGINTAYYTAFGDFLVTATSIGCSISLTVDVIVNPLPIITVNTPTICVGQTANLTATNSAISGSATYSWSSGVTATGTNTATASPVVTTTYTVTGTSSGCSSSSTVTVIVKPKPLFTYSSANVLCRGNNTGSITITATVGTLPFQYSDNGGSIYQNSNVFSGLNVGNFLLVLKDSNSCVTSSQTVTITQPASLPSFTYTSTNALCIGSSNGSITVTATGGTGTFLYSKDGGVTYQTSNIFNGLFAGTYQIVVKDANNCVTPAQTVTITQPASLPSFTYTSVNILCNGANTGSITVTATGGTGTKQYSKDGGVTYQTSNIFNGLFAGTYQIVVKDANNCAAPAQTVFITETATLLSFTYTSSNLFCNGVNTGIITATAAGGTLPYQYSINGYYNYQSSPSFSNLTTGTYYLIVKDTNNCSTAIQAVTITQPPAIATVLSHSNVGCLGGNNGSATVSATGGTGTLTYNWQPYGGTATTANNLTAGTYTVTITDNNSCTKTATVTITQPAAALTVSHTAVTNTSCGATTGQIISTVTGGTSGYNYMWSNGGNTNSIQNLTAGNYSLTVTDVNGCTASTPILTVGTIHPNFNIAFTAIATTGTAPFFAGFTNATPNISSYNFTWYWGDATSTVSNSGNVTHTFSYAGFYDISLVAVNIATGCADTLKRAGYIFVSGSGCNQTAIITPNSNYNGCAGDTLLLTASTNAASNYVYQWNLNSIPIFAGTNSTLQVTQSGYYTVTVSQGGCPITSNVVNVSMNTNPPTPLITTTGTLVACVGGSVTLTASALSGGSYLWNTGATTQAITVTSPGMYSVTENYGSSTCHSTSLPYNLGTTLPVVPICEVSVDSLSTHNIVVWEKTGITTSVDSFRIYRETMTNVYSNIASVSKDSLSEFHDYAANPNVTSYKYKLAAVDSCGSVSALSDYHNTIHLQYLGNGNLLWSLYGIENASNPVSYYIINRDNTGTGNFLPISTTIPGGNNSYTDINYATYPNARYRVDVNWSIICNPSKAVSSNTHSNIINLGLTTSISQSDFANSVSIYPNPFTEQTTISFSEIQKNTTIKIMDVVGKEIKTINFTGKDYLLEKEEMNAGIYFVQIIYTNKNMVNRKVVMQ